MHNTQGRAAYFGFSALSSDAVEVVALPLMVLQQLELLEATLLCDASGNALSQNENEKIAFCNAVLVVAPKETKAQIIWLCCAHVVASANLLVLDSKHDNCLPGRSWPQSCAQAIPSYIKRIVVDFLLPTLSQIEL